MDTTRKLLVLSVLGVWGASCVAAIVNPDLIALAGITTPVISAVVAGAFADAYLRRRKEDDES